MAPKLYVGHPVRKVGDHAARGFTIAAAFFAFTRSTSASNASARPMRRLMNLSGLPTRRISEVGYTQCIGYAVKHDAFGLHAAAWATCTHSQLFSDELIKSL